MSRAFFQDILRSIIKGWKRFFAILTITALGVGMTTGLHAACLDLYYTADQFFDAQDLFDIQILSTLGLTEQDVEVLSRLPGVKAAEGGYIETVTTEVDGVRKRADMTVLSPAGINMPKVILGRLPVAAGEIAVTQAYLDESGKGIGDTLIITEKDNEEKTGEERPEAQAQAGENEGDFEDVEREIERELEEAQAPTFVNTTFTITGVVVDPKDVRGTGEGGITFRSSNAADYSFFITQEDAQYDVYTVVYVVLSGTKELDCFSDEYEARVQAVVKEIESKIKQQRTKARYIAVLNEAKSRLSDAEHTMNEKFAEAEQRFADAWREIYEAREKIADGEAELKAQQSKAKREIAKARELLEEARQKLIEAEQELLDGEAQLQEGFEELLSGEQELEEGKEELLKAEQQVADGERELLDGERQLADGESKLAEGEAELERNARALAAAKEQFLQEKDAALAQFDAAEQALDATQSQLQAALSQLQQQLSQLKAVFGDAWPQSAWDALADAAAALAAAGADDAEIAAGTAGQSTALVSALETQLSAMRAALAQQISEAESTLSGLEAAVGALEVQLETALKNVRDAEVALMQKQAEADTAQADLNAELEKLALLQEGTPEYAAQQAVVAMAQSALDAANDEVIAAQSALDAANSQAQSLTAQRDAQAAAAEGLRTAIAQMRAQAQQLETFSTSDVIEAALATGKVRGGLQALSLQREIFAQQKAAALQELAHAEAELAAAETEIEEGRKAIEQQKAQLEAAKAELEKGRKEWEEGKRKLEAGWDEWRAGAAKLEKGWAEWREAKAKLIDGWAEYEDGKEELLEGEAKLKKEDAEAKAKIADAWKEIEKREKELLDGEAEVSEKEQEYAKQKREARQKLADAYAELSELDMTKWYVQDRTSLESYFSLNSDLSSIAALGRLFPLLFLLVAVLMSLTTMTRMVEEERGFIGTYMALGFGDSDIYKKYILFALIPCLLGGVLGDVFGFIFMPRFLAKILETLYVFPRYYLRFDFLYGLGSVALFILAIVGVSVLVCRNELNQSPAALLRPKAPKSGSRVWLERVPAIWKRLKFLNKVTVRNLFRYKKRLFMTIGGVMGCTALIVCGFAIKDSVLRISPNQYEEIYHYDMMAVFAAEDSQDMLRALADDPSIATLLPLRIEPMKLLNAQDESASVQLMVIPGGSEEAFPAYIHLKHTDGTPAHLDDQGMLVTQNAARILGLEAGDTAKLQTLELDEDTARISGLVQNYLGNNVYMTQTLYEKLFGAYEHNAVLAQFSEACGDPAAYVDALLENDSVLSAVNTASLKEEFSFDLIYAVVLLLIVMAGALAFVVLFTLANTNISERSRELATIKVLGFYDQEVYQYVNKETMLLSILGILAGLPAGRVLTELIIRTLNMPGIHFAVYIQPLSYLYAAAITLCFTIMVNWITNRILDRINMVEALKSIE